MTRKVVTRFAPSPTGYLHIGGARTALYNWLFARHHNGEFLLRIEDTDRKRYTPEAVQAIIDGMQWMGLGHDGEIVSQYENRARHVAVAEELLAKGHAYRCYATPEELEAMREAARAEGRSITYDRRWRDRDPAEAPAGAKPVIRIKAPLTGETILHDKVQGDITVKNEQLDDFVILRADGSPTYMLAVVVDDHDMEVTHIIRGNDHMNNAFRQKVIYDAMGWDMPVLAHVPLIHGPDGAKLSKRHGAQAVHEYRDMGYLPEAMRNYLLRLGWSHGDDEIISTEQAIEWFNLEAIGRSPARFDFDKLASLNAHYISSEEATPRITIVEHLIKHYQDVEGIECEENKTNWNRLTAAIDELRTRSKTFAQMADDARFFLDGCKPSYTEKAESILSDETAKTCLETLLTRFQDLEPLNGENVQATCKQVADELFEGKLGKVGMPLRAALTGTTSSPSIFHAAAILGKEEVVARLQSTLEKYS